MKEIVASNMILFATVPKFRSSSKSNGQSFFRLYIGNIESINISISESFQRYFGTISCIEGHARENAHCPGLV